jgi:hypothetical protein
MMIKESEEERTRRGRNRMRKKNDEEPVRGRRKRPMKD